jgi:hypothetical protein
MEGNNLDVLGPVDYVVVEFPADDANFSGEMAAELTSLVDRELVRVLDLLLLRTWSISCMPTSMSGARSSSSYQAT